MHVVFSEMKSKMKWRTDIHSYAVYLCTTIKRHTTYLSKRYSLLLWTVMVSSTEFISHEENLGKIFQK
jgi:hypothetical protein